MPNELHVPTSACSVCANSGAATRHETVDTGQRRFASLAPDCGKALLEPAVRERQRAVPSRDLGRCGGALFGHARFFGSVARVGADMVARELTSADLVSEAHGGLVAIVAGIRDPHAGRRPA